MPKTKLKRKRAKEKMIAEIKIHRPLNHEGIVAYKGFFEDTANVYLMLELCKNKVRETHNARRRHATGAAARRAISILFSSLPPPTVHQLTTRSFMLPCLYADDDGAHEEAPHAHGA